MVVYRHFVELEDQEDRDKQVVHLQQEMEVMAGTVVEVVVVVHQ